MITLFEDEYASQRRYRWDLLRKCLFSNREEAPTDAYINRGLNKERPYDIVDQQELLARRHKQLMEEMARERAEKVPKSD